MVFQPNSDFAVDPVYGCHLWQGRVNREGYPLEGGQLAHRLAYVKAGRVIAPGLELDHLCRRTRCVRVEHLEPVSRNENERRKAWRRRAARKACPVGHDLYLNGRRTPEGGFSCLVCCGMKRGES